VQRQRKVLSMLGVEDDIDAANRRSVAERLELQASDVGQIELQLDRVNCRLARASA